MEWFKHVTDSHEDPDISDAWDSFGDAGPIVFWTLLEVYGKEFNSLDDSDVLTLSIKFFERKLRRKRQKFEKILEFFEKRGRLSFTLNESFMSIKIPKFLELSSNWTRRQKSKPTEAPTEAPTAIEVEEEVEVEIKNKNISSEPKKSVQSSTSISFDWDYVKFIGIEDKDITKWQEVYPAVNIGQEIGRAEVWAHSNPTKRKNGRSLGESPMPPMPSSGTPVSEHSQRTPVPLSMPMGVTSTQVTDA